MTTKLDELTAELRRRRVHLRIDGARLLATAPKGTLTPELRVRMTALRSELLTVTRASGFRHLISLQRKGSALPLYMVHPFGGGLKECRALALGLGREQPVFGLLAEGFDGSVEPLDRIEEMADAYLREIRQHQPSGPYFLAGYCFGGHVAFEMARGLAADGLEVAFLGIIDCHATRTQASLTGWDAGRLRNLVRALPGWYTEARSQSLAKLQRRLRRRALYVGRWLRSRGPSRHGGRSGEGNFLLDLHEFSDHSNREPSQQRLREAHYRALYSYRPVGFSGRMTLFRSRSQGLFVSHDLELGWGGIVSGGVEVIHLSGTHWDNIGEPSLELAETLGQVLSRVREEQRSKDRH